jgi:hypothetical protein
MPFDDIGNPSVQELRHALDHAAAMLTKESQWCRREEATADGRRCLLGALKAAGHADRLAPVVLRAAIRLSRFPYRRLDVFNDDMLTDHRRLIAVLAEARRELENAGEGPSPSLDGR